jgi:hypothetical protein
VVLHLLGALDLGGVHLGGLAGFFAPYLAGQDNHPAVRGDVDVSAAHPFIREGTQLGLQGNPRIAELLRRLSSTGLYLGRA